MYHRPTRIKFGRGEYQYNYSAASPSYLIAVTLERIIQTNRKQKLVELLWAFLELPYTGHMGKVELQGTVELLQIVVI